MECLFGFKILTTCILKMYIPDILISTALNDVPYRICGHYCKGTSTLCIASDCTSSIVTRSSRAHAWFSPSFLSYWLNHVSNVFQQMTVKTDPQG